MSRKIKYFGINWLIGFIVFNLITFIVPADIMGTNRFCEPTFWVSYTFVTLSFITEIVVSMIYGKREINERFFLNIPVIRYAYANLITLILVGTIFMVFSSKVPAWIGAIICVIITALYVCAMVKSSVAAEAIEANGTQTAQKTCFIKDLKLYIEEIEIRAKEQYKENLHTVLEEVKYTDTVSSDSLKEIEADMQTHAKLLEDAVLSDRGEDVKFECEELKKLIKIRAKRCQENK